MGPPLKMRPYSSGLTVFKRPVSFPRRRAPCRNTRSPHPEDCAGAAQRYGGRHTPRDCRYHLSDSAGPTRPCQGVNGASSACASGRPILPQARKKRSQGPAAQRNMTNSPVPSKNEKRPSSGPIGRMASPFKRPPQMNPLDVSRIRFLQNFPWASPAPSRLTWPHPSPVCPVL